MKLFSKGETQDMPNNVVALICFANQRNQIPETSFDGASLNECADTV